MADAGESIAQAPAQAGRSLGHKLGPLPVWAWMVVGVVGAAGVYYVFVTRQQGSSAASPFPNIPNMPGALGGFSGGGGGGSTGGAPDTGTPTGPTTASANQIQTALNGVATSLRLPFSQVKMYWDEYLTGTSPIGNSQASGQYNNVVNALLTSLGAGAPQPQAPQGVSSSPFTNNQSWLNSILAYLPSGTTGNQINEIVSVVNGTASQLSQGAADALTAAENVVGGAPAALSFNVGQNPADVINGLKAQITKLTNDLASTNAADQGKVTTLMKAIADLQKQIATLSANQAPNLPTIDSAALGKFSTDWLNRWAATFAGTPVNTDTGAGFQTGSGQHGIYTPLSAIFADWSKGIQAALPSGITLTQGALLRYWNDFQTQSNWQPQDVANYIRSTYQQYNKLGAPGQVYVKTPTQVLRYPAGFATG